MFLEDAHARFEPQGPLPDRVTIHGAKVLTTEGTRKVTAKAQLGHPPDWICDDIILNDDPKPEDDASGQIFRVAIVHGPSPLNIATEVGAPPSTKSRLAFLFRDERGRNSRFRVNNGGFKIHRGIPTEDEDGKQRGSRNRGRG